MSEDTSAEEHISKSDRTRATIREAAIASFRERGYDATTIRYLADELGISVGSAYYHFPSKSHLIQELYVDVANAHAEAVRPQLAAKGKLAARVRIVILESLRQLEPYGEHANEFLVAAIEPGGDASPLSGPSAQARDAFLATFNDVVAGTSDKIPKDIAELLPAALYRANLLASLAWVQDRSPGHARTKRLVERGTSLLGLGLPALRIPPVKRALRELLTDVGALGES
ncbi:TetR/AcrR family transcriptional regulator [Microbacterium gorillae]|uniref:TetR/AcrR family transcriptional regulator n=1 Tax=Microbacterium gorillae TaxID=1231063 RepID=UPI00058DE43B|nr:TetR/AcrR family transcriptional regulator [Microbacterium gorillae]